VDSPKGDLDGSTGTLSGPTNPLVVGSTVYPFGTTEQYPDAFDQEGHFYMECSNKGLCNRDDGSCECFPGYEGSACQRASCPNDCSGHGTCETIKELAEDREDGDLAKGAYAMSGYASAHAGIGDLSGIGDITYELWDKTLTMGCKCDPGFMGPDCSMKICRYGVDPLFIPSNYLYSADGVIEYDWDAPHFEKAYVEIIGEAGMKGQFDLTIYDVYGEKYVLDALNYASYESGNYTSCADIMKHFPNDKIKDTVVGTFHHQMAHKGGLVSSAYVGGATKPFCTAMMVNTTEGISQSVNIDTPLQKNALGGLELADQTGIRYEFDYNRGNPGYIKDLFIDNVTPEPTQAGAAGGDNNDGIVYAYYGITKQGEVAEYSDTNKNFDASTNRFMYAEENYFQSGKHDVLNDYQVTLPGFIISAKNGSKDVVLSRDNHFYLEGADCRVAGICKQYKTAKILLFGREYTINRTQEEWLQVEYPHPSDYVVGPESEVYNKRAHVFRPVTNMTLTEELHFPHEGVGMVDYNNISYWWSNSASTAILKAYPERVPVKAKLVQVYQYVSECSGRGTCDRDTGLCSCFTGYSHDNCDTQTPVC
jgi:hypothetical protein